MHGRPTSACGLALAVLVGCAEPPQSTIDARPQLKDVLADYELVPESVAIETGALAWQAPPANCPHVYRLHAHYEPALMHESDNTSTLAIGRMPKATAFAGEPPAPGEHVELRLFYQGLRAEKRGTARAVFVSAEQLGPSAPTAACSPRTWDPMEDALALGWPRLPARLAAVDEHWPGLRVGGRCARSACVDPATGGGGENNHHRTCVTMSWDDRLAGVYEIGGERFALVESRWSDGQPEKGIRAERLALVSIDHGRPAWARAKIEYDWPEMTADKIMEPIERTWTLESVDACPGSLAAVGWVRPDDVVAEHDRVLEQLTNSDELLRREEASKRKSEDDGRDPFAPPPAAAGAPPS